MNTVKIRFDKTVAENAARKGIKIRLADKTGDSVLSVVEADTSVEVSWEALDNFMDECVKQFGSAPPVWAGRDKGGKDLVWGPFKKTDDMVDIREILVHYPVMGG